MNSPYALFSFLLLALLPAQPAAEPAPGRLLLSGDRIFFPGLDGKVYAVQAATGEVLRQRDLGSPISTALLLAEAQLFAGAFNHRLYRLSPRTREITAEHDAGDFPHSVLTFANGSLVALVGEKGILGLDLAVGWPGERERASALPEDQEVQPSELGKGRIRRHYLKAACLGEGGEVSIHPELR